MGLVGARFDAHHLFEDIYYISNVLFSYFLSVVLLEDRLFSNDDQFFIFIEVFDDPRVNRQGFLFAPVRGMSSTHYGAAKSPVWHSEACL